MILTGETVYTANARTNKVDRWRCVGESADFPKDGSERFCTLRRGMETAIVPRRCVFLTEEAALAALSK